MPSFWLSLVTSLREKIVTAARWGIEHEPEIHYGEIRPIPLGRRLPLTTDCSGFVTLCYYLAGAPDPNGSRYSGYGWTGTLLRHLPPIGPVDVRKGDIVVWGSYPGRHCAIVLEADDDPLLCSHGVERGPIAIRFSAECRYQPPAVTWLGGLSRRRHDSVETGAGAAGDDMRNERDPGAGGDDRCEEREDAAVMSTEAADTASRTATPAHSSPDAEPEAPAGVGGGERGNRPADAREDAEQECGREIERGGREGRRAPLDQRPTPRTARARPPEPAGGCAR